MTTDPIRWGILSTGRIAGVFVEGLRALPDAQVVAVGSRSQDTAEAFGAKYAIPRRHGSYAALAADPEVDIVYVAPLHPWHKETAILCLNAGKAVLCEKPFTMNAREAREVVRVARRRKRFLMEAMWTRFMPLTIKLRRMLADGVIGDVRMLQANFGFDVGDKPEARHWKHSLGGGALLDLGVYAVSYAHMIFGGPPESVSGAAHLGATGVDDQESITLKFPGGRIASLCCAVRTSLGQHATIYGTAGRIRIEPAFLRPAKFTLSLPGKPDEVVEAPYPGNGYTCEAAAIHGYLREGKIEGDLMPLDETIEIMKTLDRIRKPWGLKYPTEE
jgi:predicted dehydrogenase